MLWFLKSPGLEACTQNLASHQSYIRQYIKFVRRKVESEERNIVLTILRATVVVTLIAEDKVGGENR